MATENDSNIARDGAHQSAWQGDLITINSNTSIPRGVVYDAVIIGGGITGLTAGLLLQNAGQQVLVAEAHTPGFGTTGGTSAHINTFADTTYKEAESGFGKEGAQLFADAINEGFGLIRSNIENYHIECDYETKTGYVYAEDDKQAGQLDDVFKGSKSVGVAVKYTTQVPTPQKFQAALEFGGQAQLHPLKYLQGLTDAFLNAGGVVSAHTMIDSLEKEKEMHIVRSGELKIKTKRVIYATHIPPGINSYSLRCAPYRSYVIGVKLKTDTYPDAVIYDMQEPYHYFRTHIIDGAKLLIAGGNDHKTGHDDPEKAFDDLEKYVRKNYNVSSVKYRWSSQYYVPVDGFPYIGKCPKRLKAFIVQRAIMGME